MKNYVTANLILDDQGGQQISVRTDGKSPTLRAEMHGNLPCVCSAGFKPSQGAKAKGMGFEMEKSPTLLAGQEPGVCITFEPGIASRDGGHVYENVSGTIRATPGDNQMTVAYDIGEARLRTPQEYIEKSPTITARCGTGGNNVPAVVFENHAQDSRYKGPLKVSQPVTATYGMGGNNQPLVICLQGNGIDRADTAGCNGRGWTENVSYTLNTIDRPAVAYCMETFHCTTEENMTQPLKARDWKDSLVIAIDRAAFNQGKNAKYDFSIIEGGVVHTLVARGPGAVCYKRQSERSVQQTTSFRNNSR